MSDSEEAHAARLTIMRTQRNALGKVVARLWNHLNRFPDSDIDADEAKGWMAKAELVEQGPATPEQAERFGGRVGDPATRLSPFGRAAMEGVNR